MTLVDDIGEEEDKSSQQFITLVTKAGNTFYLIIDRDKVGNQNVHFLNMVDEADLLALMDEEEAAKYQEKKPEVTEPAETEKPQETEPAPEDVYKRQQLLHQNHPVSGHQLSAGTTGRSDGYL